jgi:hypothetical protein
MTYHVPMCWYCDDAEVAAPFSTIYGDGGFCSAECERKAGDEAAEAEADRCSE